MNKYCYQCLCRKHIFTALYGYIKICRCKKIHIQTHISVKIYVDFTQKKNIFGVILIDSQITSNYCHIWWIANGHDKKSESKYIVTCAWHKSLNVFALCQQTNILSNVLRSIYLCYHNGCMYIIERRVFSE